MELTLNPNRVHSNEIYSLRFAAYFFPQRPIFFAEVQLCFSYLALLLLTFHEVEFDNYTHKFVLLSCHEKHNTKYVLDVDPFLACSSSQSKEHTSIAPQSTIVPPVLHLKRTKYHSST
jgi:hypothetical protein